MDQVCVADCLCVCVCVCGNARSRLLILSLLFFTEILVYFYFRSLDRTLPHECRRNGRPWVHAALSPKSLLLWWSQVSE